MRDIATKLRDRLNATDSTERCGFVTKRGRVVEIKNVHDKPEEGFHMDPRAVIGWLEKDVIATWHTHPSTNANLSGEDYSLFLSYDDLKHYIVSRDEVRTYVVENGLVVQL